MSAKRQGGWVPVILLALGCGRTSAGEPGAASSPGAGGAADRASASDAGNGAVGDDAPVAGDGSVPDPVAPGTLARGTCGVLRAIQLPGESASRSAVVTRQAGGFAVGPWRVGDPAQIAGVFIDATGQRERTFVAEGAPNDVRWSVLMADRRLVVDVYVADENPPLGENFNTRFWAEANHAPTERGTLLSSQ